MRRTADCVLRTASVLGALLLGLSGGHPLAGQVPDSTTPSPPDVVRDPLAVRSPQSVSPSADSAERRPTTPTGAMLRSFLIPGWGQATYGRKVTAGIMLGVEGLSMGMILKVKSEQAYIEDTGSDRWRRKRQEQQDWITILVFNHLMSGLEAYVSSHLYDFPGDLELRAGPTGRMQVGITLPLGPR